MSMRPGGQAQPNTCIVTLHVVTSGIDLDLELPLEVAAHRLVAALLTELAEIDAGRPAGVTAWRLTTGGTAAAPGLLPADTLADAGVTDGDIIRLEPCEREEATWVASGSKPSPEERTEDLKRRRNPFVVAYKSPTSVPRRVGIDPT